MYGQVENEIKHFGILGMHWGKRKAPTRDEKYATENKKLATAHKKWKSTGKAKPKDLLIAQKNKENLKPGASKKVAFGGAMVTGMLASNFGSLAIFSVTKNPTLSRLIGTVLGMTVAEATYGELRKPK